MTAIADTSADPMESVASSLEEASQTLEMTESTTTEETNVNELVAKTVYSTFYYFSYGVCFAGFFAAKLIPTDGIVGQGLRDGATAAKDAVERLSEAKTETGDFEESFIAESAETEATETAPAKNGKPKAARSRARA